MTCYCYCKVARHSWLYVATVTKIFLIDVSAKDKESKSELDSLGAKEGTFFS